MASHEIIFVGFPQSVTPLIDYKKDIADSRSRCNSVAKKET
jgi:hypothetical protein